MLVDIPGVDLPSGNQINCFQIQAIRTNILLFPWPHPQVLLPFLPPAVLPPSLCIEALWPDHFKRFHTALFWWRHYQAWILGPFCVLLPEPTQGSARAGGISGTKGRSTVCCPPLVRQGRDVLQLLPLLFVQALGQGLVPHRVTVLNCCSRKKTWAKGKCWVKCSRTQTLLAPILIRVICCYGYIIQDL